MNTKQDILSKIARHDGITVPDNYFADFAERLTTSLPERPELESPDKILQPRTPWQRVRPYVYMAAMFAGVWCMLKMFSLINTPADPLSIDSYPELADALDNDQVVREIVVEDLNQWSLYDDMMNDDVDLGMLLNADSTAEADMSLFEPAEDEPVHPTHILPDQVTDRI